MHVRHVSNGLHPGNLIFSMDEDELDLELGQAVP